MKTRNQDSALDWLDNYHLVKHIENDLASIKFELSKWIGLQWIEPFGNWNGQKLSLN